jgi:hypothetical protein
MEYLNNNIPNFKSTGDAFRCLTDLGRFQLELLDRGIITDFKNKENPYKEVVSHIKQLLETKKKIENNTNENSNNTDNSDVNTASATD